MSVASEIIKDVGKAGAKAATAGAVTKELAKEGLNVGKQAAKGAAAGVKKGFQEASGEIAKDLANSVGDDVASRTARNVGRNMTAKNLSKIDDLGSLSKKTLQGYANDLGLNLKSKATKADYISAIQDDIQNRVKGGAKGAAQAAQGAGEVAVKSNSGIKKNALIGGAVGSVAGAGLGGIAGIATGADEDNTKSMVFMGALTGGLGGAFVGAGSKMFRNKSATGSMFSQQAAQAAQEMASGGANKSVLGGAKGILNKAGASAQNFTDKLDNIGTGISNSISKGAKQEQLNLIKDIKRANPSMGTADILKELKNSGGIYNSVYNDNVANIASAVRKGNTFGGAAQGAIMGAGVGAVMGGIGGATDDDSNFFEGALKGGFIGGTLGGIGGGVSGYFNNSPRILSNTTSNVNSLFKGGSTMTRTVRGANGSAITNPKVLNTMNEIMNDSIKMADKVYYGNK